MSRLKLITILLALFCYHSSSNAQKTVDMLVSEIESNNTGLVSIRQAAEAEKIAAKTGLFPINPEIGFNLLQGNPALAGNRKDFNITQTFDFPGVYVASKKISVLKTEQLESEYKKSRRKLWLEAGNLLFDLRYLNAMIAENQSRMERAEKVVKAYEISFSKGETGIIELNKARLAQLNLDQEIRKLERERTTTRIALKALNGGKDLTSDPVAFNRPGIPENFDEWYVEVEKLDPDLRWLQSEEIISNRMEGLARAESLPGFQAGYMSEAVPSEQFRGLTFGIEVPLWENKNRVKYAKAYSSAVETTISDYRLRSYSRLKSLYIQAVEMDKELEAYRNKLAENNNAGVLAIALDKGEISLFDYYQELSLYYESYDRIIGMEKELSIIVFRLTKW